MMTHYDLLRRLSDHPFKPFRIRMANNVVYDIWAPWLAVIGHSSAVIATKTRQERGFRVATDWKMVSIHHMVEFSDLNAKRNGRKRKP